MEIKREELKWKGFKREKADVIKEIVIHATGGAGTLKFVQSGGRASEYKKGIGLFHFLIGLDGEVYQLLPLENWCYHSSCGHHDKTTIGIECEKKSADNCDDLLNIQYENLNNLVSYLKGEYDIEKIVTHDHNRKVYSNKAPKPCPGKIDIQRLEFKLEK